MKQAFVTCLTLLLFAGISPQSVDAEAKWIRVSTAHFSMFTSNGERRSKDALLHFEQVRSFFQQATKFVPKDDEIIQVVAFQNEKEYQPYRLNAGATAYYQRSQSEDFIVMGDIDVDHYPVAVHEYTHLVVEHSGLKLPLWLNEGLAELYSNLEPQGDKTLVGKTIIGRAQTLQTASWMDAGLLFGVTPGSPYYSQPAKMEVFYAESWLLTHMLVLDGNYGKHFAEFLTAVNGGMPGEEAIRKVYGKDLKALNADMHAYFGKSTIRVAVLPIKLTRPDEAIQVATADDLDLRLTLAQLLIGTNRVDQAVSSIETLSKEYRESAKLEEVQMDLAFRRNDMAGAQSHCMRAFDLGSRNPQMLYNCAALTSNTGLNLSKVSEMLTRVLEVQPANREGRLLQGFTFLREEKFGAAISAFAQVKSIPPDRASQFYSAQGYALLRLGSGDEARKSFELAKKWATTEPEKEQADRLLEAVNQAQRQPPPLNQRGSQAEPFPASGNDEKQAPAMKRANGVTVIDEGTVKKLDVQAGINQTKGLLEKIDCGKDGLRIYLRSDAKNYVFTIASPDDVLISSVNDNETFTFNCGAPLNRMATIYFLTKPDMGKVDGVAKRIAFEK